MKVRLIGLPHEVAAALAALHLDPHVYVVSESAPYQCRGNSAEVRVYVELRCHENEKNDR